MKFLLLDTTFDRLLVAVNNEGNILYRFGNEDKGSTSANIIPKTQDILNESGLNVGEIDCIFAVTGPGSFTGIRIGVSTAEAIAFGVSCEKCGLTVFDGFGTEKLCVIPSRRGYFYYRLGKEFGEISEEELFTKSDFYYRNCTMQCGTLISDEEYVKNLFKTAEEKIESGNLTTLEPLYLKKSQAERMRELKK